MQNDRHRGSLGSKFEDFGAAPSEGLWDAISDSLDGKKKRRAIIWWWIGSGLAAVTIISVLLVNGSDFFNEGNEQDVMATSEQMEDENATNQKRQPLRDGWSQEQRLADKRLSMESITRNESSTSSEPLINVGAEVSNDLVENEEVLEVENDVTEQVDDQNDTESYPDLSTALFLDNVPMMELEPIALAFEETSFFGISVKKEREHKFEIGFGANHWSTTKAPRGEIETEQENFDPADTGSVDVALENVIKKKVFNTVDVYKHVGLVLHVGYRLTDRFRITSGLLAEYTLYRPHVDNQWPTSVLNDQTPNAFKSDIGVFSLGLPIGFEYDFLKRKRFRMGTGFNVLNEIPIVQRYKPTLVASAQESKMEQGSIGGYNMGLNLNLNVSYYLNEKLRLQANPGVRWYAIQKLDSNLILPKRSLWFGGSLSAIYEF